MATILGYNSDFRVYYGTDFSDKNAMWRSSTWFVSNADLFSFTSGCPLSSIPLNSDGYPLSLPYTVSGFAQGQIVHTNIFSSISGPHYYPAGTYQIHFDGQGTIRMRGDGGNVTSSVSPFNYTVNTPGTGGMNLAIMASTNGNPVRNLRVLYPGVSLASYDANPWADHFSDLISGFANARFMNWMASNNSTAVHQTTNWASRVPETYYTQTSTSLGRGMSVEKVVDFCNRHMINPWTNFFHSADSDYVEHCAQYFYDNLDPQLVWRPERSNEIWNPVFPQAAYFRDLGLAQGLNLFGNFPGPSNDPSAQFWASIKAQARRVGEDFHIIEQIFGVDSTRIRKVIGSFVVNPTVTRVLLESYEDPAINTFGGTLDEAAVAPYWGIATNNSIASNPSIPIATVMSGLLTNAYTETSGWLAAQKVQTNLHGVDLSCYESGYNSVILNNAPAQARVLEARRHPQMQDCYAEAFRAMDEAGIVANCVLGFIFPASSSGCWGALEHEYQDTADSPTWQALQAEIASESDEPEVADTVNVSEALTVTKSQALAISETVTVTDDAVLAEPSYYDVVTVSDAVSVSQTSSVFVVDAVISHDAVSAGGSSIISDGSDLEVLFPDPIDLQGTTSLSNYTLVPVSNGFPVTLLSVTPIQDQIASGEDATVVSSQTVSIPSFSFTGQDVGNYLSLDSPANTCPSLKIRSVLNATTVEVDQFLIPLDMLNGSIPWTLKSPVMGVNIETTKPTSGALYTISAANLIVSGSDASLDFEAVYTAFADKPKISSVEMLDEGQVVITFSDSMLVDEFLTDPAEYSITGPNQVFIKSVKTLSTNQVMLTTVGLDNDDYQITVNASGTPHDLAGNPIDPVFNQAIFSATPALAARSVFVDRGPITKPPLTLLTGATGVITDATTLTLPTAVVTPSMVGLYITLTGTTINAGTFRISSRLSPTVIRVVASFSLPDSANGTIGWTLFDPRDGIIADDPTDVVVRINSVPVVPEAVIGLLGQIVLSTVPDPTDTVDVDYSWICNPVVDFRRLNSTEFRLNNWNRDNNRPTDAGQHKYRYNNTLIQPETYIPLDIRAQIPQPQQRDLKYRAYERAYTALLNDPNTLLLNSPNHRIAFPPLSRSIQSIFVNYQPTTLPENDPSAPWERHGSGSASVALNELTVIDNTSGPFPGGDPIFWTRPIDLTFPHVFATAWRVRIPSVPVYNGVFTGIAAGYSDAEKAVVVGFLEDAGVKKVGILKANSGNDPSILTAWGGGFDSLGNPTGGPIDLDWSILRSYRVFRDRSGVIRFYVDGSVAESLRVVPDDLPFLEELNDPFNALQGAFFGSMSREAENTSAWSFVRYTAIPINPMQSAPSVFVSYEGTTPPEFASQPWTPVGFHGTETIIASDYLLLDSTSATDLPTESVAGLISGDFKGFSRIEPLLAVAADTVLDVNVSLRTFTHGVSPNAIMAAIDDGNRLIQLCFFPDQVAPKFSYGGRSLPNEFAPYLWGTMGGASSSMVGQYLKIEDASNSDGLVYFLDDLETPSSPNRVVASTSDYILEFRAQVESYTPDIVGYAGVMSQVYDSQRTVGILFEDVAGIRYVTFHSDGTPVVGGQFAFDWFDNEFHTYRAVKSTTGNLVSLFIDGIFIGSTAYSNFNVPPASNIGVVSFGSATPLSVQAQSVVLWAYSNYWRVNSDFRKFAGLWKGYDPNSLTGYHLPTKIVGRQAAINGNVLTDALADFVSAGITSGDQIVIDAGDNKGVYTVAPLNPLSPTTLSIVGIFPVQPSVVDYRVAKETDWSAQHRYRILKDPSGGISVSMDSDPPMIHVGYNNLDLPSSTVGIARTIAGNLPSIVFGAFDPTNLSQASWDFVRFGATRTQPELGIVPHHQVLNQRNIMASFEHHRTVIPHTHTDFWSESEGIPPQTEPDLLRNPALVAYTLLNDRTPLVPSTQTYEVRSPTPVLTPIHGLNQPADVLGDQGFVLNDASQEIQILVPDDVLYNSLQVIERSTGDTDLVAPFDDECQPNFGTFHFDHTSCLTYDGTTLPEDDSTAATPWTRVSDDASHQFASVFGGVLTYGTDSTGTKTIYRNNTPLTDQISLQTEVKFRLRVLQDSSGGLGDSQVRVGFSSPGVTVGLAFITSPIGDRYVLAIDLNNGLPVGGIPFDFYDGLYHDYRLVRDPGTDSIQIFIDS